MAVGPLHALVLDVAIGAIEVLRPIVTRIRNHDRDLGEQLRRALSSSALNIAASTRTKANAASANSE